MRSAAFAAGVACILGLGAAADVAAQELGRLFFTPEQRAALDARRKARVPDKPAAVPQVESPVTRVNGVVQRAGGRSTVWVNNEAIQESAQADVQGTPRPAGGGRVTVPLGEGGSGVQMRVGESLNRGSGEISDIVGKDGVKVNPQRGGAPRK
ncbi:MAG: hypothetical protein IT513_14195 [Burkholderiales bacterium]|nr:hypothetical protein [Burkholderiales bacterium]